LELKQVETDRAEATAQIAVAMTFRFALCPSDDAAMRVQRHMHAQAHILERIQKTKKFARSSFATYRAQETRCDF